MLQDIATEYGRTIYQKFTVVVDPSLSDTVEDLMKLEWTLTSTFYDADPAGQAGSHEVNREPDSLKDRTEEELLRAWIVKEYIQMNPEFILPQ